MRKKTSSIIAIFLILAIAVTIVLIQQGILTITRARLTADPENLKITNITDTSFTIVYTTGLKTTGIVRITNGNNSSAIILDDRDKSTGTAKDYFSHHITVPNLEPQKTYNFIILSENKEYSDEARFIATTGSRIEKQPPSQNPLYGTVLLPDGNIANDSVVTAKTSNSQTISTVTDEKGSYILPTNSLRNVSLSEYIELTNETQIFLDFYKINYIAKITTDFKLGQNLPTITLNQNYSFSQSTSSLENNPSEGFADLDQPEASSTKPNVTTPQESQSFIDQNPLFSGIGGASKSVDISIEKLNINASAEISAQGRWSYRPENDLPVGDYSVTFDIPDENGINSRITRSFSILSSGSQIAESATPSATPIFNPTPTTIPSITISPTASLSPTGSVSVTPTGTTPQPTSTIIPSVTPNITLIPTGIPTSTPLPPIEKPGSASSFTLAALSIFLIVAGAAIFFAL